MAIKVTISLYQRSEVENLITQVDTNLERHYSKNILFMLAIYMICGRMMKSQKKIFSSFVDQFYGTMISCLHFKLIIRGKYDSDLISGQISKFLNSAFHFDVSQ